MGKRQKQKRREQKFNKYVRYLFEIKCKHREGTEQHMIAGINYEDCVKNLGLIWGATKEDIVGFKKSGGEEPSESDGVAHED